MKNDARRASIRATLAEIEWKHHALALPIDLDDIEALEIVWRIERRLASNEPMKVNGHAPREQTAMNYDRAHRPTD